MEKAFFRTLQVGRVTAKCNHDSFCICSPLLLFAIDIPTCLRYRLAIDPLITVVVYTAMPDFRNFVNLGFKTDK